MKHFIYADNAATTKLDKDAFNAMLPWLQEEYGNASQPYSFARKSLLGREEKDSDTKQTVLVPNAEFKIFNIDKNEYVKQYTTYPSKVEHTSFFTDEDGDLILPEALKIGNYRIEEVKAPFGYVVNDN